MRSHCDETAPSAGWEPLQRVEKLLLTFIESGSLHLITGRFLYSKFTFLFKGTKESRSSSGLCVFNLAYSFFCVSHMKCDAVVTL